MMTETQPRAVLGARTYLVVDLVATALFGLEGAATGAAAGLDLLGIVVVGFSTAVVGGILRDILLGEAPPAVFRSPSRIIAALVGCLAAILLFATFGSVPVGVLVVLDAAALALFAATGARKAAGLGANLWVVVMLGTITAVGGGVVRDILLAKVPVVLTASVYASAAAAGALVVGICLRLKVPPVGAMALGFFVCLGLRLAAVALDWQLPTFR
jgi:uncharacterized membrane protein YeiH